MEYVSAVAQEEWASVGSGYEESEFMTQIMNMPRDFDSTSSCFGLPSNFPELHPCSWQQSNIHGCIVDKEDCLFSTQTMFPSSFSTDSLLGAYSGSPDAFTSSSLHAYAHNISCTQEDLFSNRNESIFMEVDDNKEIPPRLPSPGLLHEKENIIVLDEGVRKNIPPLIPKTKAEEKRCVEGSWKNPPQKITLGNKKESNSKKKKSRGEICGEDGAGGLQRNNSTNCCCSDDGSTGSVEEMNSGISSSSSPVVGKRACRGSATDPQSLYARRRREKINERLRILQNLVPNGTKVDISTMLEEAVQYVKFLQLQIKLLSSDDLWMYAPLAYNGMNVGVDLKIVLPR